MNKFYRFTHTLSFSHRLRLRSAIALALLLALMPLASSAATLTTASVSLTDPQPNGTGVKYDLNASGVTLSNIQCLKIVFATTATGSTKPTNMVTSAATLDGTTNFIPTPGAFSRGGSDPDGTITFTGSVQTPASASSRHLVLATITNSSVANTSYFMQVSTYNNTNCSSSPVDNVTVAFIITNGSLLSLTVDPTLSFTVNAVSSGGTCNGATSTATSTATTIPFGSVTSATNSVVCQDLTVTTNAPGGYTVYSRYTGKPTSGANQIADSSGTNGSPASFSAAGTEAYGYTTNDFTLNVANGAVNRFQSNLWAAMTTTNAEVAYDTGTVANQTTRVGHQVGISGTTKPGTYTTTIIYTCTPIY